MVEPVGLEEVSSAVVVRGASYDGAKRSRNDVLATARGSDTLDALRLALAGERTDAALMRWPALSIACLDAERRVVCTVGVIGGGWLRLADPGDWRLTEPDRLDAWLAALGIEPPLD